MIDPPFKEYQVAAGSYQFLGEPSGSALGVLKRELAKILLAEGHTKKAYLSKIQYLNEDNVRLAVIIDGSIPAQQMVEKIAAGCQPLVKVDLFFFESLSSTETERIKNTLQPFFPVNFAS